MTKQTLVSAALMFLLAVVSTAGDGLAQKKEKPPAKPKPVLVAVVQIDGAYQILPKGELAALKTKLKQEHKDALAAHKAAAADAKKNKEKFREPAPKARKMKVVKASIGEAAAEDLVAKLRAKDAKKTEPKAKKPKPKQKPKPDKRRGKRSSS